MKWRFPKILIKNKFISTFIGTLGIYLGLGFILPISYLSVYITSYIHVEQNFVTMHYGFFLNLILTFAMTFSFSIGGILENKIGFTLTTLFGTIIVFITNIFYFKIQNIWICYCLTFIIGIGAGISASLLGKNLTFYYPKKKAIIVSILGLITILFAGGFLITGEKIINKEGKTLEEDDDGIYAPKIANRTYLYLMLGFFSIPIGDIIFLLFAYEYDKNKENKGEINTENLNLSIEDNIPKSILDNDIEKERNDEENLLEEKNGENSGYNNLDKEFDRMTENKKKNVKKVIKTFRFWRITIVSFLLSFSVSFMITTGRTFGAIIGINGVALQFLTSLQGISIIIIGPILGIISDKKGPMIILRICSIICIIPGVLLMFFIDNTLLYMISFIFIAIGLVAKMVSYSPLIMEIYGIQESVILSGIINGFGKLSEVITTVSAFVISFYYSGKL